MLLLQCSLRVPPRPHCKSWSAVIYAVGAVRWLQVAAESLKAAAVTIGDATLTFEAGRAAVQLYVGNVSAEFADADSMRSAMEEYGPVERAFIMLNPLGLSKVWIPLRFDSNEFSCGSFVNLSYLFRVTSNCQPPSLCGHHTDVMYTFRSSHLSAIGVLRLSCM